MKLNIHTAIDLCNCENNQRLGWKMHSNQATKVTPLRLIVDISLSPHCSCLLNPEVAQNSSAHRVSGNDSQLMDFSPSGLKQLCFNCLSCLKQVERSEKINWGKCNCTSPIYYFYSIWIKNGIPNLGEKFLFLMLFHELF